jgi:hypothetical protein
VQDSLHELTVIAQDRRLTGKEEGDELDMAASRCTGPSSRFPRPARQVWAWPEASPSLDE